MSDEKLTPFQEKVLAVLPLMSGLLSAWGSLQIIRIIVRNRIRRPSENVGSRMSCYQRIMLGLSLCDLVSSIVLCLQAFLLPKSEGRSWAIGNQATCTAMGFLQQLFGATIFYSVMLSFVFLLTIRYDVTEARLSSVYEPWMHGVSIGFPLVSACAVINWYGPLDVGQFCWISGQGSAMVAYLVAGIPYFLIMIIIPTNNVLIYRHVRRQMLEKRRGELTASLELEEMPPPTLEDFQRATSADGLSTNSSSHDGTTFSNEQSMQSLQDQRRQLARRQDSAKRGRQRLQQVAWQAFYYVFAFVITQLPAVLLRVCANVFSVRRENEAALFWLLVFQAVLWPLQGFFNYLIYTQTAYLREFG